MSQLQLENEEQYKTYSQTIEKVQHKADLQVTQMERELTALTDSLEKTQAQLHSVLSASNLDQTALGGVTKKIEVLPLVLLLFSSTVICILVC